MPRPLNLSHPRSWSSITIAGPNALRPMISLSNQHGRKVREIIGRLVQLLQKGHSRESFIITDRYRHPSGVMEGATALLCAHSSIVYDTSGRTERAARLQGWVFFFQTVSHPVGCPLRGWVHVEVQRFPGIIVSSSCYFALR